MIYDAVNIEAFAEAWLGGKVCLHPTDTLPGLSFHPRIPSAQDDFMAIKDRPENKRPICLVADQDVAKRSWQALPSAWDAALQRIWPASLSVIWLASESCPESLVASDGTVAFRMPHWSAEKLWMRELLLTLDLPFPSSSVNRSGEAAEESWVGALAFAAQAARAIYTPDWAGPSPAIRALPSTVIRLQSDGSYEVLREGALEKWAIDSVLAEVVASRHTTD
jgi:tRNA A37 threonylcarbamoyladenosine synthetase subunit TsaC/SUA5/YrdC